MLCTVRGGYLNRVGLRNPGAHTFAKERLLRILAQGAPVVQSLTGGSEAEIETILEAFAQLPLAGYELNASCPNVPGGQRGERNRAAPRLPLNRSVCGAACAARGARNVAELRAVVRERLRTAEVTVPWPRD